MNENINKKKPIVVATLIITNIVIYTILEFIGDTTDAIFMLKHGAVYPDNIMAGEYWRLLTATFMHFGARHLFNNMLLLGCAGVILEEALGHLKFALLYLIAGAGGSTLSYLQMCNSGDYAVSAGASGAIFGIIGALLWIVIRHKGRYETLTQKGLIFMIALSLYYGVENGEIDNWGHIGGLIAGFIISIILYRKRPVNIDFDEKNQYTY